jgi:hypothetical protein
MATRDFLPATWSGLAEWYRNFALNLTDLAAKYGITEAVQTSVANDNNWIQYWVAAKFTARQQEKQLTDYAEAIADSEIGAIAPPAPAWSLPPNPPVEVAPGLRKRVRQLANQIKSSANYTEADGALLGIISTTTEDTPAAEMKPFFTAHAMPNYAVALEFKRLGMDSVLFEIRRANGEWVSMGTKTASPAKITIQAIAPEQIQIRAVFIKKDEPVGAYSDIVTVTIAS